MKTLILEGMIQNGGIHGSKQMKHAKLQSDLIQAVNNASGFAAVGDLKISATVVSCPKAAVWGCHQANNSLLIVCPKEEVFKPALRTVSSDQY